MATNTVTLTEFLSAFFPDENETICLRSFKPKKAPDLPHFKPEMLDITRAMLKYDGLLRVRLKEINTHNGLYFVVNSGGHVDHSICRYNAWFVESDTLSLAEQHLALDQAPIAPSIRVETKSSVHAYYLVDGPCSDADWKDIQCRLIAYFNGDPKIKNPSRVMRLPYYNHISLGAKDGEYIKKRVEIAYFDPKVRYRLADMQKAFPEVAKPTIQVDRPSKFGIDEYDSWERLGEEARRRMVSHPTAHHKGEWIELKGVCHDGNSNTALTLNMVSGKYFCRAGCSKETILSALGLPIKPTSAPKNPTRYTSSAAPSQDKDPYFVPQEPNPEDTQDTGYSEGIIQIDDLIDDLDVLYATGNTRGDLPGWPLLNELYTVKPKQLTIVTGAAGSGKSAFLDAMFVNLVRDIDKGKIIICSFENQPIVQHISQLLELATGKPFTDGPTKRMTPAELTQARKWLNARFIFLQPKDSERNIGGILKLMSEICSREKVYGCLIDPWNEVEHLIPNGMNETMYISMALTDIRQFARANDIHFWLVAHPRTLYRNKEGKLPTPTLHDISGSIHFRNKADFGIVISRDIAEPDSPTVVDVQKVRFRWCGKLGQCELYFDKVTGRYQDSPIFTNQYSQLNQEPELQEEIF